MKKEFIYKTIERHLYDLIKKNENVPDYKLPSEWYLVNTFKVSRVTVRKAFESLEKRNFIYRVKRKGTFINRNDINFKQTPEENFGIVFCRIESNFSNRIIGGIQCFCRENNINPLIVSSNEDPKTESRLIRNFLNLKCRGLIIMPPDYEQYSDELAELSSRKYPIVLVDRCLKKLNFSMVLTDHHKAMHDMMKALIKKGFQRITYITQPSDSSSAVNDRNRAFDQALLEFRGTNIDGNLFILQRTDTDPLEKIFYDFFQQTPLPDAVIMNSGIGAIIMLNIAKSLKLENKIQFAFFDDEMGDLIKLIGIKPFIVRQDAFNIGYTAAKMLYEHIYNNIDTKVIKIAATTIDPEE